MACSLVLQLGCLLLLASPAFAAEARPAGGAGPSTIPGAHREPNAAAAEEIANARRGASQGKVLDALESARKAARLDSLSSSAYEFLGVSYQSAGRPRDAYDAFRRATLLDPASATAWNRAGQVLLSELGRPEGARAAFEQALRVQPAFPPAHYSLGVYHLLRGELPLAEKEMEDARSLSTDEGEARVLFGARLQLLLARGRYDEAENGLRSHLFEFPGDRRSIQARALALRELGRLTEAREALGDLMRVLAPQAVLLNELGQIQLGLGVADSAEATFRQAWDLDSTSSEAGFHLALSRLARKDTTGALTWLSRVDAREPGWYPTDFLAGRILLDRGDEVRGRRALERAKRLNPLSNEIAMFDSTWRSREGAPPTESPLVKGEKALLAGDLAAAVNLGYLATTDSTTRALGLLLVEWSSRPTGLAPGSAVARLEAALEALPASDKVARAVAERELGRAHMRIGNREEAKSHLQQALTLIPAGDPASSPAVVLLLRLYLDTGDRPSAERLAAQTTDADEASLLSSLARVAEKSGDTAKAAELRERARDADYLPR